LFPPLRARALCAYPANGILRGEDIALGQGTAPFPSLLKKWDLSRSRGPTLLWRTSSLLGFGCQD
ncbi:MAG: hypothetical protein Q7S81_02120, partial [bacterium]|nr:hypothetical protein [bacterium]